jgi:PDZ domain-containing protein
MHRPGRTLTWDEAIDQLSSRDRRGPEVTPTESPPITKRSTFIGAAVIAVALSVVALLYHPPLAVVTTGRPIDVVRDISIAGASFDRPTGRYLMTTVDVDRANLAGTLYAWALRRTVIPTESGPRKLDLETERNLGREAFLHSHRQAVALAERELGVDAKGLTIAIRDRGIKGPSAGLIYALAIVDMLDSDDLAAGRVIAATGELRPDASVGRVGFVRLKAQAARDGGAAVFLVPASQRAEARQRGMTVLGVASLKGAVRSLSETYSQ